MDSPFGDFLRPDGYLGPHGVRALSRESTVVLEALRLVRRSATDHRECLLRRGSRSRQPDAVEPVLLVPGFMAGDATLAGMAHFLRSDGFRTYRSTIHLNVGCTREAARRLEERLESIAVRRGRKVSVVGHSLGGMLARALAVRRPDLVDRVVALGSPVLAPGAVHGLLAWDTGLLVRLARTGMAGLLSDDCVAGECARLAHEEVRAPLPAGVNFTAIYSRRDGVVDWRACLDPQARHVEVRTSHCGMAVDPSVLDAVRCALQSLRPVEPVRQEDQASPASQGVAPGGSVAGRLAAHR